MQNSSRLDLCQSVNDDTEKASMACKAVPLHCSVGWGYAAAVAAASCRPCTECSRSDEAIAQIRAIDARISFALGRQHVGWCIYHDDGISNRCGTDWCGSVREVLAFESGTCTVRIAMLYILEIALVCLGIPMPAPDREALSRMHAPRDLAGTMRFAQREHSGPQMVSSCRGGCFGMSCLPSMILIMSHGMCACTA
eukprot:2592117-Pleurochrysis_carterae.AAC.2